MSYQKELEYEVSRVAPDPLAVPQIVKDLKRILSAVEAPKAYKLEDEWKRLAESSKELSFRLDLLKRFNRKREGEPRVNRESKDAYLKEFKRFLRESPPEDPEYYDADDVFLRKTMVEVVVLRKFGGVLSVLSVEGDEEFLVEVKDEWPGLGYDVGVGDILKVFKPKIPVGQDGKTILSTPDLLCCYHVDVECAAQFLENMKKSNNILGDFVRCRAIWEYILNYSITNEQEQINLCKSILSVCEKVAAGQTLLHMSEMTRQFWSFFKGKTFLKDVLPRIANDEDLQDYVEQILSFIESIVKVLPECAIIVLGILKKVKLEKHPDSVLFMQKLLESLAENITGAKDDIDNLQWNQRPLIPTSCELLDSGPDWRGLPCIKVKSDKNKSHFRYESEEEYLRTNFILLREECLHNLKSGVRQYIKYGQLDSKNVMLYRIKLEKVASQLCHEGLSFLLELEHIKSDQATEIDPDNSRWLMTGNLLCISLDASFRCPLWATVANVSNRDREKLSKNNQVNVTFCSEMNSQNEAEILTKLQKLSDQGIQGYMFESNTFYVAFGPPLDVLQQKEHVPFKEQLVQLQKCAKPPDYLKEIKKRPDWKIFFANPCERETTMDYSYKELLKEFRQMRKDPKSEAKMDVKQLDAVEQALCNDLTLIQGPPGTGKSYVGERLLEFFLSCLSEEDGPILVVTYKNFALDHFLEDCLTNIPDFNSKLVRVGGGGDSINQDLESCKLFQLMKEHCDYRRHDINFDLERNLSNQLDAMKQELNKCDKQLRCAYKLSNFASVFVQEADIKHLKSLIGDELDTMTKHSNWRVKYCDELCKKIQKPLQEWLPKKEDFLMLGRPESIKTVISKSGPISDEEDGSETDPSCDNKERLGTFDEDYQQCNSDEQMNQHDTSHSIDDQDSWTAFPDLPDERLGNFKSVLNAGDIKCLLDKEKIQMVYALLREHCKTVSTRFRSLTESITRKCKAKKELVDRRRVDILKKRKVIGMTVSGAAIRASWFESVKPSVMIVEEAAEILEPQLVAIIPTSVQHLIMIGDQQQLKPQVSHYKLARACNLQTSMFERLIKGELDYTQLSKQGRMIDDLAELVRQLGIYDKYETRKKVVEENWKLPPCLQQCMYFYTHTQPEKDWHGTHSKCNEFEARKVAAFAKYLCDFKIEPSKITILCSYLAQVKLIKIKLGQAYSAGREIQVTTIDSFQGKESEIIILSLVRSSEGKKAKIGYLAKMNRICVAVSRARCGLYIFGNEKLLKKNSAKGWGKVITFMADKGCVGEVDKSFPFNTYQQCGITETDGPICDNSTPSRTGMQDKEVRTLNIIFNAPVQANVIQFGDNNTVQGSLPVSDGLQQGDVLKFPPPPPQATSGMRETSKVDAQQSTETPSMEETRKIHVPERHSVEETRNSGDLSPQELSSQDQELLSSERLLQQERDLSLFGPQPRELSFHDPALQSSERHDANINNQGTTVQGDGACYPSVTFGVQEEKDNTAFQESNTDEGFKSGSVQDTNTNSNDR